VNTDESEYALYEAERRVLEIQTKLHRWAREDAHRRFDDLHNLVADPAFLLVAWAQVRSNKGAKTAGVDGRTAPSIALMVGVGEFLDALRASLRDRSFRPLPVRERMIPKAGGKLRRLGIATIRDRVVQASLKLVVEPIFEADFLPCSYGFRPNRRAHDAVADARGISVPKALRPPVVRPSGRGYGHAGPTNQRLCHEAHRACEGCIGMNNNKELWKSEPDEHDYPAAESYLSLLAAANQVSAYVAQLKTAQVEHFKAKDILRASGLSLLAPDNPHVAADLKKIRKDVALSPVLLVRGVLTEGRPLQIADGYHRVCASYHTDENTDIPCKIVG
jgi:hypothetical protein